VVDVLNSAVFSVNEVKLETVCDPDEDDAVKTWKAVVTGDAVLTVVESRIFVVGG